MTPSSEFQKPFNEQGRLNAEIITRMSYCGKAEPGVRCECDHCEGGRDAIKCRVNKIMGRKFYEDVDGPAT